MELDIHDKYFQISDPAVTETQFSGNDNSDFLIILPKENAKMDLVMKILNAIQISDLSDVQVLELKSEDNISSYPFISKRNIKKILSFGIPCDRLGLNVDNHNYKPFEFRGVQIIVTAELEILDQNNDHKKILWNSLKNWIQE